MNAKTFIDTNVLIYAHDVDARGKRDTANGILRQLWNERSGGRQPTGATGVLCECDQKDCLTAVEAVGTRGCGHLFRMVCGYHRGPDFRGVSDRG